MGYRPPFFTKRRGGGKTPPGGGGGLLPPPHASLGQSLRIGPMKSRGVATAMRQDSCAGRSNLGGCMRLHPPFVHLRPSSVGRHAAPQNPRPVHGTRRTVPPKGAIRTFQGMSAPRARDLWEGPNFPSGGRDLPCLASFLVQIAGNCGTELRQIRQASGLTTQI